MIVRETASSFLLITQPDHAMVARRIVEPWTSLSGAPRRASILRAVEAHDNGWQEPDAAPIVDVATGRIYDFVTAPREVRESVWPRGVGRLAADPWAAALVAQHAITIYDRFRADPAWSAFFTTMTALRDRHVAASRLPLDALEADYTYLRIADLASLTFCNEWSEEQRFGGYSVRLNGQRLVIAPDPYVGVVVSFSVTARELPRRPFASDADARSAFISSRIVTLSGRASGSAASGG